MESPVSLRTGENPVIVGSGSVVGSGLPRSHDPLFQTSKLLREPLGPDDIPSVFNRVLKGGE
jgi:hypothetical protein